MISKLDNKQKSIASTIREVFQSSYKIEAKLLNADYFPPLHRPLSSFIDSKNQFYGHHIGNTLTAVMELKVDDEKIHIQSMVVDPNFFRRGIASKLLNYLFKSFDTKRYYVETGAANGPAIALYERFGFVLINQWMTDVNIEKVAFEKRTA